MDSLFSEDPQFRRVQYTKLSDNTKQWPEEISALVNERLPQDLGLDSTVIFQKVDDEKGYAVGTAIAQDGNGQRQVGIPIVIKSWHLAPLDLFFKDGKVFPLTEDNLAQVFFQSNVGTGLAPKRRPPDMADDAFQDIRNAPQSGKYTYSAPISELIDGTFPDYQRVIPADNDKVLEVDCAEFTKAVDRVSTISTEKSRAIKLALDDGTLVLSASSPEAGTATEELEVSYGNDPMEIGFNSRYLLDITQQIEGNGAKLTLADAASPTIIQDASDTSALYVLMPMRV